MNDFLKDAALFSLKHPGKSTTKLPKHHTPKIVVFRHCETFDNKRRLFSGRRDTKLTPTGISQAKKLAKLLKNLELEVMYYPNLVRCKSTSEEVLAYHANATRVVEPLLLERDYGRLTGKSKLRAMREFPKEAILWRRGYKNGPPGGESLWDVEKRVLPFCKTLERKAGQIHGVIGVCATNNTFRIIRRYFEHLSVQEMQVLENPYADYAAYGLEK